MFNTDYKIIQKWKPILEHNFFEPIKDKYRKIVTARVLENYERDSKMQEALLEAPYNVTGNIQKYDPVLISLLRRTVPNLIAFDVCGVQPLSAPTGLIFSLRPRYNDATTSNIYNEPEAFYNEPQTGYSGGGGNFDFSTNSGPPTVNKQKGENPADLISNPNSYNYGTGMSTASGESLGDSPTNQFREMGFTIEKVVVNAKTRALKAEYSVELAQDYKAVHGGDAEAELVNILATEILAEINREIIRTIYVAAVPGSDFGDGMGDLDMGNISSGTARWLVERFKLLMYIIERDANAIAQLTRRGKGNIIICSADLASALAMTGLLDYGMVLEKKNNWDVDVTGNTFVGTLNGYYKVYIDPYADTLGNDLFYTVGYKGKNEYDAGLYYCPYIPLQLMKAIDPSTFQPKIGFKTRYGVVQNPFVLDQTTSGNPLGETIQADKNIYYRKRRVRNMIVAP